MGFFIKKIEEKVKPVLGDKEKIILMFKQSLLNNISPTFIVVTDQRLITINNSFWGLYVGVNLFAPTDYNYMPYSKITGVVLVRGRLFSTLDIRLLGGFDTKMSPQKKTEGEIDGLRLDSAIAIMKFVQEKIGKPEEAKPAKEGELPSYKGGRFK